MNVLRPLTGQALARAIARLRDPKPGGKVEAAREFGVDLTLLMEQLSLSPAERARRMHALAEAVQALRDGARK